MRLIVASRLACLFLKWEHKQKRLTEGLSGGASALSHWNNKEKHRTQSANLENCASAQALLLLAFCG
jgi:hypothetical protein